MRTIKRTKTSSLKITCLHMLQTFPPKSGSLYNRCYLCHKEDDSKRLKSELQCISRKTPRPSVCSVIRGILYRFTN